MQTDNILNYPDIGGCYMEPHPISTWTVRPFSEMFGVNGINECLYIDNSNGQACNAIGYDGYTQKMDFSFSLMSNAQYRIKIFIVEGVASSWAGLDSGVFIKKAGYSTLENEVSFSMSDPEYNDIGATVIFDNTSSVINGQYLWDFGDGSFSNEINPIHTFDTSQDYLVTLSVLDGCGEVSGLYYQMNLSFDTSSIDWNDLFNIDIYPNPADDYLHINVANTHSIYSFDIVDTSGRIISHYKIDNLTHTIDLSLMHSGMYYLNFKNHNQGIIGQKKLVIL